MTHHMTYHVTHHVTHLKNGTKQSPTLCYSKQHMFNFSFSSSSQAYAFSNLQFENNQFYSLQPFYFSVFFSFCTLRILAMYEAKNSKIFNFCTFWPLLQLINHLLTELSTKTSRSCYFLLFLPHT